MANASMNLEENQLLLKGDWTYTGITKIQDNPFAHVIFPTFPITIGGQQITHFDTAGAWLLSKILATLADHNIQTKLTHFSDKQLELLALTQKATTKLSTLKPKATPNLFARIGEKGFIKFNQFCAWMNFVGEVAITSLNLMKRPWNIKWSYCFSVVEMMGWRALPILGFLSFLIGIVLTYQTGLQLKTFGANIYIVSLIGISVFREFGPLITAIILAGRTTSSFTAQLGIMKTNEELDALKTMGLSPIELLVFPRIFTLILIMPLLTVWSDCWSVLGGMVMSNAILDVNYTSFLHHFDQDVDLYSFIIGICKAPAFAMIIASVGCFHGLQVSGSSESIGWETTKSVVLSIFLIILVDGIFSIILSFWGI